MIVYCSMKSDLLKDLNPPQQEAVKETIGPILILAGAGSGKTRVLTYKVAYLILEKHISPDNILMVTFTNKAAREMKERIIRLLSIDNRQLATNLPFAGTFHSFCAKVLRRDGRAIGISPNFVIYDKQDQKEAIKEAVAELNIDKKKFSPAAIAATISSAKNELLSALEYLNLARGFFQEAAAKVYIVYQKKLSENNALDFDDLLFYTVELFKKNRHAALSYQDRFHYILVDEYQDTNHAQYELTKILAKKWRNLCVVGDASQSIYAFRGADFRNILNFKKDFPTLKIFHLEQNYRSTQNILDAATFVISKNLSHPVLRLWTQKEGGEMIKIYQARSEHDEAEFIINQIVASQASKNNFRFSDFAILYRTNAQSREVEEVLLHAGIPYILVGGVRFYERKEIKDILAFLRLLVNPKDNISCKRIKKLGIKRWKNFLQFAKQYEKSGNLNKYTTVEILDQVLENTSYRKMYDQTDEEDLSRLENIAELYSVATQYKDLGQFIENVSLVEREYLPQGRADYLDCPNAVTLMTLHAAKGLEFKTVFMVGMEEGLFPHARSLLEPLEIEEERRLCYVGMTRAMEQLYLIYASRRLYFGQRSINQVSRFLEEIPEHLVTFLTSNYPI